MHVCVLIRGLIARISAKKSESKLFEIVDSRKYLHDFKKELWRSTFGRQCALPLIFSLNRLVFTFLEAKFDKPAWSLEIEVWKEEILSERHNKVSYFKKAKRNYSPGSARLNSFRGEKLGQALFKPSRCLAGFRTRPQAWFWHLGNALPSRESKKPD